MMIIMLAAMKSVMMMLITMMRVLMMVITIMRLLLMLITMMRMLMMGGDKAPDITGFSTKPETLKGIKL